jgi:hypothetical protein
MLSEVLAEMVHTKDGRRVVRGLLPRGTAKVLYFRYMYA